MKYLIVDDEKFVLVAAEKIIKDCVPESSEIITSQSAVKALELCRKVDIYVVFLDIDMPEMNGIEFCKRLYEISPNTNVIFITGYTKYSLEAWNTNASDFLMKPLNHEDVRKALGKLRNFRPEKPFIKCFGSFNIIYGNETINFKRKKSKEFFAYLIHRMGAETSEDKIRFILWSEPDDIDEKRTYIRSLAYDIRNTFKQIGVEDILINTKNIYRMDTKKFECDYYNWVNNLSPKPAGEYMEDYTWAESVRVNFDKNT